jgi:hypothetical protein
MHGNSNIKLSKYINIIIIWDKIVVICQNGLIVQLFKVSTHGPVLSSCLVADWVDGILVFTEKLWAVEGRVFLRE